jgi:hypothetical protein
MYSYHDVRSISIPGGELGKPKKMRGKSTHKVERGEKWRRNRSCEIKPPAMSQLTQ